MSVGSVIKESRISKSLKQTTIANEVGVSVQTYIKWENNETEPKASQVAKLSEILKISSNSICKGEADKKYELTHFMRLFSRLNEKASDFETGVSIWEMIESDEEFLVKMRKNAGIPEFTYDYMKINDDGEPVYLNDGGIEVKDPLWS